MSHGPCLRSLLATSILTILIPFLGALPLNPYLTHAALQATLRYVKQNVGLALDGLGLDADAGRVLPDRVDLSFDAPLSEPSGNEDAVETVEIALGEHAINRVCRDPRDDGFDA